MAIANPFELVKKALGKGKVTKDELVVLGQHAQDLASKGKAATKRARDKLKEAPTQAIAGTLGGAVVAPIVDRKVPGLGPVPASVIAGGVVAYYGDSKGDVQMASAGAGLAAPKAAALGEWIADMLFGPAT